MLQKRNDLFGGVGIRNDLDRSTAISKQENAGSYLDVQGMGRHFLVFWAKRLYYCSVEDVSVGDVSSCDVSSDGLSVVDSTEGGTK